MNNSEEYYNSLKACILFNLFWEVIENLPENNIIVNHLDNAPINFEDLRYTFRISSINEAFDNK